MSKITLLNVSLSVCLNDTDKPQILISGFDNDAVRGGNFLVPLHRIYDLLTPEQREGIALATQKIENFRLDHVDERLKQMEEASAKLLDMVKFLIEENHRLRMEN